MRDKPTILLSSCAMLLLLAACNRPPVEPEQPPEPRAVHGQASRALHEPLDKARAVEDASSKAAEAQRQAIEAAGG
ncbi:hypothetical protein INQ40_01000 [Lysobacter sp. H21R4]|uniref:hypothetical protein n=1 Tax=Lysobacter sp. H21R4 TaxID=2781021 RepID=UPI00188701B2|nr:hypothetical protein [Lysobacter sp. H21R4]QOY62918.1 hypothetical protein INQ40_01000 [Lysobacter sp. H21R4]